MPVKKQTMAIEAQEQKCLKHLMMTNYLHRCLQRTIRNLIISAEGHVKEEGNVFCQCAIVEHLGSRAIP